MGEDSRLSMAAMDNTYTDSVSSLDQAVTNSTTGERELNRIYTGKCIKPVSAMITLELITDPIRFHRLRDDWDDLQSDIAEKPKQTFDWLLKTYKRQQLIDETAELSVLVGRHEGEIVMIWPFMKQYSAGICQLRFIENEVEESCSAVMKDHPSKMDWLMRCYAYLVSEAKWDCVNLKGLRKHSLLFTFLRGQSVLCLEAENGEAYDCLLACNLTGQAYNGLLQGHRAVNDLCKYIRTVCSSLL